MIAGFLNTTRFERILKLLDQERQLILGGPLADLKALVERREAAMTEILATEGPLPEAFLAALKSKAERNSRLLLASLAGVRSAADQITHIQASRNRLGTYSADGHRVELAQTTITRDKRA